MNKLLQLPFGEALVKGGATSNALGPMPVIIGESYY
jgi:hypothetical protein